jgi:hypothetical protein
MRRVPLFLVAGLLALAPGRALAADEEIQVYMDELNAPGEFGLDMHVNDVLSGDPTPEFPGAETSLHRWRITPEFSLGLGGGFELGAYLPLTTIAPDGAFRVEGVKARLKWLAPHGRQGFYWGANFEIGRVDSRLDVNPWNAELKLIGGWRDQHWIVAANSDVDFAVSGPSPGPATFDLTTKLAYRVTPKLALGIESYNGLGELKDPLNFAGASEATYLALDTSIGKWDLNAGIGKTYGDDADSVIMKFVVGVPI